MKVCWLREAYMGSFIEGKGWKKEQGVESKAELEMMGVVYVGASRHTHESWKP